MIPYMTPTKGAIARKITADSPHSTIENQRLHFMRPIGFFFMIFNARNERHGAATIAIATTAIQNSFGGMSSVDVLSFPFSYISFPSALEDSSDVMLLQEGP